jgi:hypothetical protein
VAQFLTIGILMPNLKRRGKVMNVDDLGEECEDSWFPVFEGFEYLRNYQHFDEARRANHCAVGTLRCSRGNWRLLMWVKNGGKELTGIRCRCRLPDTGKNAYVAAVLRIAPSVPNSGWDKSAE